MTDRQWLKDLFEYENCDECHKGAEGHVVVLSPLGNRFARCIITDESSG